MAELNLDPGEYAITQLNDVSINNSAATRDLVLTNRHLYAVTKSLWGGRTKEIVRYRLDQIPVINGQAQAKVQKTDYEKQLVIQFKTGHALTIGSANKRQYIDFASQINALLTGAATAPSEINCTTANELVESVQDAFAVLDPRTYLGGKNNTPAQQGVPQPVPQPAQRPATQTPLVVSSRCVGCHAPISGYSGQRVACGYCDTEQIL